MLQNMRLVLALLTASALAAPGSDSLLERAACNANNCLRAVRATNASPFPSSATKYCSNFMLTTVAPCPITVVTTVSTTLAADTSIVTSIIEETATITQQSTIVTTITSYSITTSTLIRKRDISSDLLPVIPTIAGKIKKRTDAPTCTAAAAISSSVIPVYASACSGTSAYSSACSCAGIPSSKTTLAQQTITVTSTSTIYTTPLSTLLQTTTDATAVVASLTSTTVTLIVPTVTTVAPACTAYKFVVTNGFRAGQFVSGGHPPTTEGYVSYGYVNFTSDPIQALPYTIRSDGRVYNPYKSDAFGWVTNGSGANYVLQMNDYSQSTLGVRSVYCSIDASHAAYPGSAGTLSCTSAGIAIYLQYCPQFSSNLVQSPTPVSPGCTAASLQAVPVAC